MPLVIRLQDIDEAIENLHYKSGTTLKAKLLKAVRGYYTDDTSSETLQAIDTEELVKTVWETGHDEKLIKAKRKNFSSLKSSVNGDLKKIYADGKNPQGLVIGPANTFTISDEAKDKALTGIMDVFQDMGVDTQSKISKILTALSDVLASAAASDATVESTKEEVDRLKTIMSGLSDKLGLSMEDLVDQAQAARREQQAAALASRGEKPQHIADYIQDDISAIDKGLAKLAREAVEAAAGVESDVKDSLKQALSDIVDALRDQETDAQTKAQKILAAMEEMVGQAIDTSGPELSGDQAGQLKQIFHDMSRKAEISAGAGEPEAMPQPPTEQQLAGGQLLDRVADILSTATESPQDKIGRIMAAVNDMLGDALAGSGLSGDEVAGLKEMMGNITANLEALAEGALAEEDIIEEIIDEEAGPAAEIVEETTAEEIPAEELPPEEAAAEEILEEVTAGPENELVEIIEEIAGEPDQAAVSEEAAAEEILEVVEEIPGEDQIIEAAAEGLPEEETVAPDESVETLPAEAEEVVEVIEEIIEGEALDSEVASELDAIDAAEAAGEEAPIPAAEMEEAAPGEIVEEVIEAGEEETAADEVEIVEEMADAMAPEEAESIADEIEAVNALEDEAMETVEIDEAELAALEEFSAEIPPEEAAAEEGLAGEIIEEIPESDIVEEVFEEDSGIEVTTSDQPLDEELREKTELLSRLAEAAGVLEKLGPDLSGSVYTEEEVRSKAQFLSEEFDRYLSIRDKFYNAHILIKGGDFLVGGAHLAKSELEEQIVNLPDFYIGKFPVTNALFEIFVEQTGYVTTAEKFGYGLVYYPRMQRSRDPITGAERFTLHHQAYYKRIMGACWHRPNGPDSTLHLKRTHPVVQVSLEDARAFAAWTGKRLPTEIEWEAAARTARGNIFPWGNQWLENACNIEKSLHGDTTPVDQYVKFANAYEVADTLGNVLEWTSDVAGDRETSDTCIVKGASWISHSEISLTDRHYIEKTTASNILGFRCIAI